jgi:hypothetical protein
MKKKILRIVSSVIIALAVCFIPSSTAFAIGNPDDIGFGTGDSPLYKVFENVAATGDILFIAEGYVYYAVSQNTTASAAYIFEVVNAAGNQTIISRPLEAYGDRPISIYLTSAQKTTLGIVSGTAYILRIAGNPLIFSSMTGNSANVTLTSGDYIDQSTGADSDTPTDNNLRNFCILMALNMQAYDSPTIDYYDSIQGYTYLTNTGADLFVAGVPNLYNFCPILFQYGAEKLTDDEPDSTGSYALTLTPLDKWGTTTANGLTQIGLFLGINQALAGSLVLFVLAGMLAFYVYSKTQSGITVLLMVSATPFMGAYLGLMPMALAFVFVIVVITLMAYYFFSRGAL